MDKSNLTKFPFTDLKLRKLQPGSKAYDCRDTGCPGLTFRVASSGKKTFRWTHRDTNGKHRVKTLGAYPTGISLADARKRLEELKAYHKESLALGEAESQIGSVGDLAELFYQRRIIKTRKRPQDARSVLDNDIIPKLGKLKLSPGPRTPTVGRMIMDVVDRGAPVHAGKVLDITRQMFAFGVSNGHLMHNPADPLRGTDLGIEEYTPRDRTLSSGEIYEFWHALDKVPRMGTQTKLAFKLLLLTGVRSQELLLSQWRQLRLDGDEPTWTIPVANQKLTRKQAKIAKDFVIPLAPQVVELFQELKALVEGASEWVMASGSKTGHFNDKALCKAMRRLFAKRELLPMPAATPHDLRRTLRTQMGETLKIEPHIAERCLNHSLGKLTATYDTGTYLEQRREAMIRWADQVDLYVNRPANVVLMTEVI